MTCRASAQTVLVPLPISIIEVLLAMRSALDDELASALQEGAHGIPATSTSLPDQPILDTVTPKRGKYAAEFLGVPFAAGTLAEVFGQIVDMMAVVAPEALVLLSEIRTRARRYVSLTAGEVHFISPYLPTIQTKSGWWISKNVSRRQLGQALRTTCAVSKLTFGEDIKFPLKPS